jgi:hypothetical protein
MGDGSSDRVYIFYDVLNSGSTAPDVILDGPSSGVTDPRNVVIADNRLFVANDGGTNQVMIFDDFVNLSPVPTPVPDVILDNATSLIDDVEGMTVVDNDLYVANEDVPTVTIYRDVDSIVAGGVAVAPDIILDDATSDIDSPNKITIADNILYVCNDGNSTVTIYENADSLVAAVAPNVTLDDGADCGLSSALRVFGNVLYAAGADSSTVTGYLPADGLTDSQAPSFTLDLATSLVNAPVDVFAGGGLVFISNQGGLNGVLGFAEPIPVSPAATPTPDVLLTDPLEVCGGGLDGVAGTVFAACAGPVATPVPGVYGYLDAGSIVSGALPDISLTDPSMVEPISLDVQERP